MRIGAVMMAILPLSTVASGMQDVAAEHDVVVIGRRMRLVRLDYALNGPHLRRCDVAVSSGDARVDRIMCAVLRRCVTAGYREPRPAKRCMDASIDLIVSGQRSLPEPDPERTAPSPTQSRSTRAPPQANPPPTNAPAGPSAAGPDIVVEASRNKPIGGQWRFTKLRSGGIGHSSQVRWERCIAEGHLEVMVRVMLNGEETRGADSRCGPMKLKFKHNRLTGERSCLYQMARMKTLVRGSVSQDHVSAEETTYLVVSSRPHVNDSVRVPEDDSLSKVYGERIGTCSVSNQGKYIRNMERQPSFD